MRCKEKETQRFRGTCGTAAKMEAGDDNPVGKSKIIVKPFENIESDAQAPQPQKWTQAMTTPWGGPTPLQNRRKSIDSDAHDDNHCKPWENYAQTHTHTHTHG
jgi:hypothetical protein